MTRYIVHVKEPVNLKQADFDVDPDAPLAERNRQVVEAVGAELLEFYYTTGQYEAVAVIEVSDSETAVNAARTIRQAGAELELSPALPHEAV